MKYIKLYESFNSSVDNIINQIKMSMIDEVYTDDEIEEYGIDNLWKKIVDNQEMGECQGICSTINFNKIPGVKTHFGEIEVDEPSIQSEWDPEYQEYVETENYNFTHHWVTIYGKIYEFSKGTLKNNIQWSDLYSVDCEGEEKYNTFR